MSQVINITSEALQATVRALLPSQQGFGEDLQASNVIVPTIDLTPTAEGSILRSDLQRAFGFGTSFLNTANNTETIASTPGFYALIGTVSWEDANFNRLAEIEVDDGTTQQRIYKLDVLGGTPGNIDNRIIAFDFTVFLRAGDTLTQTTSSPLVIMNTASRQIADVNGNLINPLGFVSQ